MKPTSFSYKPTSAEVATDMARKRDSITSSDKGVSVPNCPLKLHVCFPSCFWHKGGECTFYSTEGRQIDRMKENRISGISRNNKGMSCPFKPIACQESYCHECQIYLDWLREKGSSVRG